MRISFDPLLLHVQAQHAVADAAAAAALDRRLGHLEAQLCCAGADAASAVATARAAQTRVAAAEWRIEKVPCCSLLCPPHALSCHAALQVFAEGAGVRGPRGCRWRRHAQRRCARWARSRSAWAAAWGR
jgi:hypothetical protein